MPATPLASPLHRQWPGRKGRLDKACGAPRSQGRVHVCLLWCLCSFPHPLDRPQFIYLQTQRLRSERSQTLRGVPPPTQTGRVLEKARFPRAPCTWVCCGSLGYRNQGSPPPTHIDPPWTEIKTPLALRGPATRGTRLQRCYRQIGSPRPRRAPGPVAPRSS